MRARIGAWLRNRNTPFFLLVFGLTWMFWIPAAMTGLPYRTTTVALLILSGGLFGKVLPVAV